MLKPAICILLLILCLPALCAEVINDFSRVNPVQVTKVFRIESVADIHQAIRFASDHQLKVSIAGGRNSQGGHIANMQGVVLDMRSFNKVISLLPEKKTIIVESGATWDQIQQAINPYGLSIKVMQSSNIFTVGGALSANVHGRDPEYGTIIDAVIAFKILLSDGRYLRVSREAHDDLFYAAIGGYGLLGVITEVELSLTDNLMLRKTVESFNYAAYPEHLLAVLERKPDLHYGRCSIVRDASFFNDCVSVNYYARSSERVHDVLDDEKHIRRNRFFFNLSRKYDWGKRVRWWLQHTLVDVPGRDEILTRNNAMRPPIAFLAYHDEEDTDILQEYFIPREQFPLFLEGLRVLLLAEDINVLSMTLRYIPKKSNVLLDYSLDDSVAVVLYINISTNTNSMHDVARWTSSIVDLSAAVGGTYYLTYHRFPSQEQFTKVYPESVRFKEIKQIYDPDRMFTSEFYKHYFYRHDAGFR